MHRSHSEGFTLIELVMSLFILGLVSGVILLTLPPSRSQTTIEAKRLAATLSAAANHSILSGETVGAALHDTGYSYYRLVRGQWSPLDEPPLSIWTLDAGSDLAMAGSGVVTEQSPLEKTGNLGRIHPSIVFYPVGLNTAFSILVRDQQSSVEIRSPGAGEITVVRSDAD